MARKLITFRHTETTYDRPNQEWSCGRECEGTACVLGPDARGRCRAGFVVEGEVPRTAGECIPAKGEYNKFTGETTNPNRWYCTRDPSRGGTCADGPLPDGSCCHPVAACRPVASLRRKRRILTLCVTALSAAAVLVFFAKRPTSLGHPLDPGPVSSAHSTANISCADCHSGTSFSLALADFHARARADALLCLKCHDEVGRGESGLALAAHNLPEEHLDLLTRKAHATRAGGSGAPLMLKLSSAVAKGEEDITCAACHQEHHGKHNDLTALSNSRCQVCHTGQFRSFGNGHPEFTSYPYRRKTRIFFDHDTHFREYFKSDAVKQHALNACSQCHTEADDGRMMTTGSFANTCAACHDADTRFDQWEILAFPKVDTRSLADQLGAVELAKLETWQGATARELGPLLKVLLESGGGERAEEVATAVAALRATDDGLQLRRHRNAPDAQKQAAAVIATEVTNTLYGDDPGAFKQRLLESRWLEGASPAERSRVGESLADIFAELRSAAGREAGGGTASSTTDSGGVFSYDAATGSLRYKPGGHADPFLKAALDTAASNSANSTAVKSLFTAASGYLAGFNSTAAGKCLKCHTADEREDGSLAVNWYPAGPEPGTRPITQFKHRSHVRLPELVRANPISENEACASCHLLEDPGASLKEYREFYSGGDLNPHRFRSGFRDLALNSCASCHTPKRAGDSCTLCHQYHATASPLEPNFGDLLRGVANPAATAQPPPDEPDAPAGGGDSLIPPGDGDSLVPPGEGDSLVPPGDGDSLVPPGEGDSLVPPGDGDSLVPPGDGDSLVPPGDGDSLVPPGDGDSLVPPGDGDSLVPPGDGDSLVPPSEGDSLVPPLDGDSLVPTEPEPDGESLLPGDEPDDDSESLVPAADPEPQSP